MKPSLTKRLEALEARTPLADRTEQDRQIHLACQALWAAYSPEHPWAKSPVPPFDLAEQPSQLDLLAQRLKAGTATDADRAALASLPPCHLTPEELVELLVSLDARV